MFLNKRYSTQSPANARSIVPFPASPPASFLLLLLLLLSFLPLLPLLPLLALLPLLSFVLALLALLPPLPIGWILPVSYTHLTLPTKLEV